MTVYAIGPAGEQRPALDALRRAITARGGLSGDYRATLVWQAVERDAPSERVLSAARRAVKDPRAAAFIDATGGPSSLRVIQLLNLAGVPVVNVADPSLRRALCASRDPFPTGERTAVAPQDGTPGTRAEAAAETLLDALRPMPVEFDRGRVNRALQARFGRC